RLFLIPLASVILIVSLPLAAGVVEPLDGLGVCERLISPLARPFFSACEGCAVDSVLVGVEGPLLKAFVSILTLSKENNPLRFDRAELARKWEGVAGAIWAS